MIDKEVFANEMGLMAGTYRYDADTPVLQAYYATLSPRLTTDEFRAAIRAVMDSERFWPSPAVILEKAGRDAETLSQQAFREVTDALNSHGGYRYLPAEISRSWDAPTWAGIKAIGGLREITEATEARWSGIVKKFCKAYQETLSPRPALSSGDRPQKQTLQLVSRVARDMALPRGDR